MFSRVRILLCFASTILLGSLPASAAENPPPTSREVPAVKGWKTTETPEGTVYASSTRVEGTSALILPFPVTSGPVEVSFTALAPAAPGHRGLNFGMGWSQPELQAYRANFLTFGGSGQVLFWDPGLVPERSSNVGAYAQGKPTKIRMRVDPTLGGFQIEVNSQPSPELYPFFAGIPRIDSLYFTNNSTRAENSPLEIRDIRIVAYDAPPTPRGVLVKPLSSTGAEVSWRPSTGAAKYRIYRLGKLVGEADSSHRFWREGDLPKGRPVAYRIAAVGEDGRESIPSWPVDALLPADVPARKLPKRYDLVVVGGSPAGIAASLSAARHGANVLLAVPGTHLGGLMAGGLGRTDYRYKGAQGGIFNEFTARVQQYYNDAYGPDSRAALEASDGYHFEPSVAGVIFRRMLEEQPRVTVRDRLQIMDAQLRNNKVIAAVFEDDNGKRETIPADAFIDATYEGDLYAAAGVGYRVGRESRAEFNEPHAGVIYWDVGKMDFLPGSTGEGDKLVQAYNYRLPLTNRAGHRYYAVKPPPGYRRETYANIPEDVRAGRIRNVDRVMHFRRVPGEEFDVNNHRYYPSTDLIGGSNDYPEADAEKRKAITEAHRRYIEGLIYFLQNDPELPASFRFDANQWGFAQDEFRNNERFPTQLYVREGRRMKGVYTFNQHDAMLVEGSGRTPVFRDSIGVGEYMMDSHATQPQEPDRPMGVLEGFFFIPNLTRPYQIPYRILVPEKVDGLLTALAVSSTHVGYGTLRMEPVMMVMGEAAGIATQIAKRRKIEARNVPMSELQLELLKNKAVLSYFSDLPSTRPDYDAFQYLGTMGLFDDYTAQPDAPVDRDTAVQWFEKAAEHVQEWVHAPANGFPWNQENQTPLTPKELNEWLAILSAKPSISLEAANEPTPRGQLAIAIYRAVLSHSK